MSVEQRGLLNAACFSAGSSDSCSPLFRTRGNAGRRRGRIPRNMTRFWRFHPSMPKSYAYLGLLRGIQLLVRVREIVGTAWLVGFTTSPCVRHCCVRHGWMSRVLRFLVAAPWMDEKWRGKTVPIVRETNSRCVGPISRPPSSRKPNGHVLSRIDENGERRAWISLNLDD